MKTSTRWLMAGALLALIGSAPAGCKEDAPDETTPPAATEQSAEGEEGAEAPAKGEAGEGEQHAEAQRAEARAAEGDQAAGEEDGTGRATLAEAYEEVYCAQRKRETDRLLEIYSKYGFEDPKAWTEAWTEAAQDEAWVAEISQAAIEACP